MNAAPYAADIEAILAHRHDLGADLWTTPDRRLIKGAPFSTLECAQYLLELGLDPAASPLKETADLIFSAWRTDGRFQTAPQGAIYPCQTVSAAATLCRLGYAADERLQQTFAHLFAIQYCDGGWRCNKFSFGRGPETECSNPLPTLTALDAFRFSQYRADARLDPAVDFLLAHWTIRRPIGPCHYGMGTLFMQVEYPFRNYNLFVYVYLLSFYARARGDPRFLQALQALQASLSDGQIVITRVNRKLAGLEFCRQGQPSAAATRRYEEILANLAAD